MANGALNKAKKSKKDEFYTRYEDIHNELKYYHQHFQDKVIYINCDNPEVSNFWKYFKDNFRKLKLKKLIATYYIEDEQTYKYEIENGEYDKQSNGITVTKTLLEGDGDFRSEEVVDVLKTADTVVTNPPFSLWRKYVQQIIEYDKEFLILGRQTAVGYRDIFPLIYNQQMWVGVNSNKVMRFEVPDGYELQEGKYEVINNKYYIQVPAISWYTNLDHVKRHKDRELTSLYKGNEEDYPEYENYPAINVNRLANIPKDYSGEMGVPITILNNFNFNQFEITGFRKGNDGKDLTYGGKTIYTRVLIRKKGLK